MEAPVQQPMASPPPPRGGFCGLDATMVAIMEGQAEELRRSLMRFKVCATPQLPDASAAAPGFTSFDKDADISAVLPPHADILIFGPSGSGKSSLIRTFYMALHKVQQVPPDFAERIIVKDTAMNEGTLRYVSATVKPAKMDHRGALVSSAIMCHDTRGHIWMDEKEAKQLSVILDGNVKDDCLVQQRNFRYARLLWEFWRRDEDLFPAEIIVKKNGLQTKPHAILFVFDGSMQDIPDNEQETNFYRDTIQMCRSKGYNPQVVLTRIDRVEEEVAKEVASGSCADADPELRLRQILDRKIEDVMRNLGLARTAVHFIENYHSGTGISVEGRNVSVDFHALSILVTCCGLADDYLSQAVSAAPRPPCVVQ